MTTNPKKAIRPSTSAIKKAIKVLKTKLDDPDQSDTIRHYLVYNPQQGSITYAGECYFRDPLDVKIWITYYRRNESKLFDREHNIQYDDLDVVMSDYNEQVYYALEIYESDDEMLKTIIARIDHIEKDYNDTVPHYAKTYDISKDLTKMKNSVNYILDNIETSTQMPKYLHHIDTIQRAAKRVSTSIDALTTH